MKRAKQGRIPTAPATVVASHEATKTLGEPGRAYTYLAKIRQATDDPQRVLAELDRLISTHPPQDVSISITDSIAGIESKIDSWLKSQAVRSAGGNATAATNKAAAEKRRAAIHKRVDALLAQGTHKREIAATLVDAGHARGTIYRALRAHSSGHWQRKEQSTKR